MNRIVWCSGWPVHPIYRVSTPPLLWAPQGLKRGSKTYHRPICVWISRNPNPGKPGCGRTRHHTLHQNKELIKTMNVSIQQSWNLTQQPVELNSRYLSENKLLEGSKNRIKAKKPIVAFMSGIIHPVAKDSLKTFENFFRRFTENS